MPCVSGIDPRLIVGWPTAEIAVMGGAQAAKVLLQRNGFIKIKGEEISKEKEEELFNSIKKKYDDQTSLLCCCKTMGRCYHRSS